MRLQRVSFKSVAELATKVANVDHSAAAKEEAKFQYSASSKVIGQLISAVEGSLMRDRNPLMRARTVIDGFLSHPDVRKVIMASQYAHWSWEPKQQRVIEIVINNITAAIAQHKNKRDETSRLLYQTLMNIVSPPQGQNLMRATARLFGLKGRKGLRAGACRIAQRQVDVEGGSTFIGMFIPGDRKQRSDSSPEEYLRIIDDWWNACRVTANTRNVVRARRSSQVWHAVHWLEHTERQYMNCSYSKVIATSINSCYLV
jgi:hypothetical protein